MWIKPEGLARFLPRVATGLRRADRRRPPSEDLGEAVGDPIILFRGSEAPWRKKDTIFVTDGCFPYRCADGTLLMLWSSFSDRGYTTGYARSLSGEIYGPSIQEELPIYSLDGAQLPMLFHTLKGS